MGLIQDRGRRVIYDGKSIEGTNGARLRLTPTNEFFTHFSAGTTIPAGLVLTEEGTTTAAATYGTGLGGWAVITSDDVAAKSDSLNGTGLNWQADRQPDGAPLVWEAKWKAGTLAANEYWLGISDALADTDPIALSLTSTFTTSVPTDGLYLGYSDTPTSGSAFLTGGNGHTAIGIKNNTNTVIATSLAVTAKPNPLAVGPFATDTFYTYRIEVDNLGNAAFFLNGEFYTAAGAAITKTVPLTHVAYCTPRTTASASMSIDYIYMGGV